MRWFRTNKKKHNASEYILEGEEARVEHNVRGKEKLEGTVEGSEEVKSEGIVGREKDKKKEVIKADR